MSGGERALTGLALLFAIFYFRPSPFCVLDEVDAPLDDANIHRFLRVLRELTSQTQFLVITHNRKTMEAADVLYGVTMEEPGLPPRLGQADRVVTSPLVDLSPPGGLDFGLMAPAQGQFARRLPARAALDAPGDHLDEMAGRRGSASATSRRSRPTSGRASRAGLRQGIHPRLLPGARRSPRRGAGASTSSARGAACRSAPRAPRGAGPAVATRARSRSSLLLLLVLAGARCRASSCGGGTRSALTPVGAVGRRRPLGPSPPRRTERHGRRHRGGPHRRQRGGRRADHARGVAGRRSPRRP